MKQGLISIIVPNRKGEKNESRPSIERQTYKNIEIIEVIDSKCEGASKTRNRGAKKAKGEYIFFCDNDVELEIDCLENLHRALQENPDCDWAFGRFKIDGIEFNINKPKEPPLNKYSKEFIDYFHGVSTMSLIRASAKPEFDNDLRRYDDWDLWIRLTRAGHKPVFCDKMLFSTKNRIGGITMGNDTEKWTAELYKKHLRKIADIIIPHHSQHEMLAHVLSKLDNKIFNIIIVSGGTFSENCNKGARLAETENLIFLNDDTDPENDIIVKMVEDENPITGVGQYIPNFRSKRYGIGLDPETFYRFLADTIDKVTMPSGFCFKVKKEAWKKLGGLDEIFRNGAEDVDLFLRAMKMGLSFGYIQDCITHYLSKSEGRFDYANTNNRILEDRWKGKFTVNKNRKKKAENNVRAINNFYYRGRLFKRGDVVEVSKIVCEQLRKQSLVA